MMKTIDFVRLWRVEMVHRNGYQAPSILIEAKKKEIHKEVKKLNLRLLDFPNSWSYQLVDLKKQQKNGKWY